MRILPLSRLLALVVALAIASTACGSTDDAVTSAPTTITTPAAADTASPDSTDDAAPTSSDAEETVDESLQRANDTDGANDTAEADVPASGPTEALDLGLFLDGALAADPTIGECVLTDGSTSQCYTVTVVGTPVNHDVGPFCPTNVSDDADAGGLWLDGEGSYEIDGPFFTELAEIYGDELWNRIVNDDGSINVIDNAAEFQVAARPDITEEYYYHCVDGDVTWLEGGEQPAHTVQIPLNPTATGAPTVQFAEGAHSTLGVTLNGAMLSGSADMTAILSSYTIAAFDDCGGHINPALGYHVHGTAGCSDVDITADGETPAFAYAVDGFTVHAPYGENSTVELDDCNGHTSEELGYHYHASSLEENATLRCLTGLTVEGQNGGGRPPGGGGGAGGRPPRDE